MCQHTGCIGHDFVHDFVLTVDRTGGYGVQSLCIVRTALARDNVQLQVLPKCLCHSVVHHALIHVGQHHHWLVEAAALLPRNGHLCDAYEHAETVVDKVKTKETNSSQLIILRNQHLSYTSTYANAQHTWRKRDGVLAFQLRTTVWLRSQMV